MRTSWEWKELRAIFQARVIYRIRGMPVKERPAADRHHVAGSTCIVPDQPR